jgi:hypothetical protein
MSRRRNNKPSDRDEITVTGWDLASGHDRTVVSIKNKTDQPFAIKTPALEPLKVAIDFSFGDTFAEALAQSAQAAALSMHAIISMGAGLEGLQAAFVCGASCAVPGGHVYVCNEPKGHAGDHYHRTATSFFKWPNEQTHAYGGGGGGGSFVVGTSGPETAAAAEAETTPAAPLDRTKRQIDLE